jgi:hypothetical protein
MHKFGRGDAIVRHQDRGERIHQENILGTSAAPASDRNTYHCTHAALAARGDIPRAAEVRADITRPTNYAVVTRIAPRRPHRGTSQDD